MSNRRARWAGWFLLLGTLTARAEDGAAAKLPALYRLPPGASVKDGPPKGWTHRVVRSVPELKTGDTTSLPESSQRTATLFRTVIAADVRRQGGGFVLARVGVGNAVPVGDRELVVTSDGPREALATLGAVEKIVMRVAEGKLDQGRIVAATPTFALFRTPAVMIVGGRHADVDLHYALLVDPATGRLRTLAWAIPQDRSSPPAELVALDPDAEFRIPLDVRVTSRLGPLPVAWSFAMPKLPPGPPRDLPDEAARTLARADRQPPARLERLLRTLAGAM